jgi:hypothetical protein
MGQTQRFREGLHQELDDLKDSEPAIQQLLLGMHPVQAEMDKAMRELHSLCGQAEVVCKNIWLDVEPEMKEEESEVLVKISKHISVILLCEWQKWLFKKSREDLPDSGKE